MAGLLPDARARLDSELRTRFGEDVDARADAEAVPRIRARGAIRSEREYRIVESYADGLGGDAAAREEYFALGALLDAFSAAPHSSPDDISHRSDAPRRSSTGAPRVCMCLPRAASVRG